MSFLFDNREAWAAVATYRQTGEAPVLRPRPLMIGPSVPPAKAAKMFPSSETQDFSFEF